MLHENQIFQLYVYISDITFFLQNYVTYVGHKKKACFLPIYFINKMFQTFSYFSILISARKLVALTIYISAEY